MSTSDYLAPSLEHNIPHQHGEGPLHGVSVFLHITICVDPQATSIASASFCPHSCSASAWAATAEGKIIFSPTMCTSALQFLPWHNALPDDACAPCPGAFRVLLTQLSFPAIQGLLAPRFNSTLSPLLANSIASLATRYLQSSDVLAHGATTVSNAYRDATKVCPLSLSSLMSLLCSDHGFTHSASSTTVLMFCISRFSMLSSSSPSVSHRWVIYLKYLHLVRVPFPFGGLRLLSESFGSMPEL